MTLPTKTVAVLRPVAQATGLLALLQAHGYQGVAFPQIAIHALEETPHIRQVFLSIDSYDKVVVVSRNAAEALLRGLDTFWPQLPLHPAWYAVGSATAEVMATEGLEVEHPEAGFTSETLLQLPGFVVPGQRYLLVKGEGGRPYLAEQLRQSGCSVDTVDLYRRVTLDYSQREIEAELVLNVPAPVDVVLVSSGEILQQFCRNMVVAQDLLQRLTFVLPSQRVLALARTLGIEQWVLAESASDTDMLAALANLAE